MDQDSLTKVNSHPALTAGRAAVITGGASGIGLAAAKRFIALGMKVCLADLDPAALDRAAAEIGAPSGSVVTQPTDVSKLADLQRLKDKAYASFGEVAVLMNNAGTAPGGGPWDHIDRWRTVLEVNLWGVINGVQTFTQAMIDQGAAGAINQHRLQAGHHLSAGRHRLQCQQGRRKSPHRGTGASVARRPRLPGDRPSAGAGLHLHRDHAAAPRREAARRLVARAGGRHDDRAHGQGRFLHHLPGQRRHLGDGSQAHPVGGAGHHRESPAAVALARRLQGRLRGLHEDALMKMAETSSG
jgi:hypothetical protein